MVPSLGIAPNIIIIHSCLPSHKLSLVNRCLKYAYIHSVSIFTMLGSAQYIRFTSRYLIFDSTSIDFLYILYIYSLFLEKSPTGMDKTHQDVLRKYAEEFNIKEKLDVETMVNSLVQEGVLHYVFAWQENSLHLLKNGKIWLKVGFNISILIPFWLLLFCTQCGILS